jgi:hypothetical protein
VVSYVSYEKDISFRIISGVWEIHLEIISRISPGNPRCSRKIVYTTLADFLFEGVFSRIIFLAISMYVYSQLIVLVGELLFRLTKSCIADFLALLFDSDGATSLTLLKCLPPP